MEEVQKNMLKVRVTYSNEEEKDKLINELKSYFRLNQISKEYMGKGKSLYKSIYLNLSYK